MASLIFRASGWCGREFGQALLISLWLVSLKHQFGWFVCKNPFVVAFWLPFETTKRGSPRRGWITRIVEEAQGEDADHEGSIREATLGIGGGVIGPCWRKGEPIKGGQLSCELV